MSPLTQRKIHIDRCMELVEEMGEFTVKADVLRRAACVSPDTLFEKELVEACTRRADDLDSRRRANADKIDKIVELYPDE